MRIGVNALFLRHPGTGSEQYTRHLLQALAKVDPATEYLLFGPGPAPPMPNTQYPISRLAKLRFEQVAFPLACLRSGIDLAHVPYFASPIFPVVPTVVTVHDLIPLILPAYRGSPLVRLYTRLVAAAARKAQAIITVSQASQRDIVRYLHIPPERIHVTYEAAGEAFQPVEDEAQLAAICRSMACRSVTFSTWAALTSARTYSLCSGPVLCWSTGSRRPGL